MEGIRGCCGRLFPLNSAISLLSSDTVDISLGLKQLGSSKVVANHTSRNSSEVLDTVCWGPVVFISNIFMEPTNVNLLVRSSAGDLPGKDVEGLSSGGTSPCIGQRNGVS